MDWTFYIIGFVVLLGFIAAMLAGYYLLNKRLDKLEKKQRMEEEARQIAESQSGL